MKDIPLNCWNDTMYIEYIDHHCHMIKKIPMLYIGTILQTVLTGQGFHWLLETLLFLDDTNQCLRHNVH